MPAKALSAKEYLRSLPRPSEVPPVRQDQLRRLYEQFAHGIEEPELLDEVESRMIARAELVQDISILWFILDPEDPFDPKIVELTDGRLVDTSSFTTRDTGDLAEWQDRVGIRSTNWGAIELENALGEITNARRGNFKERMIALDSLIQIVHGTGKLATMFVEDEPLDPEEFLDRLSGVAETSYDVLRKARKEKWRRRPEVHVRPHWRRTP